MKIDLSKLKAIGSGLLRPEGVNICFGWEGRKIAFIGSLEGNSVPYFEIPFPGMRLIHQKL
jgi:hypothetical protein